MKYPGLVLAISLLATPVVAQDNARIEALENRVQKLEKEVAGLKSSVAPVVAKAMAEQRVDQQRAKARQRMREDQKIYSREQLKEIEKLYQVANKQWRSKAGKESLEKLVSTFGQANRTGCALLYLGQMSRGDERRAYLERAATDFPDCYYGDGVQVGAYARWYLAHDLKDSGDTDRANELFNEIRTDYPDAVDHKGRLLAEMMAR